MRQGRVIRTPEEEAEALKNIPWPDVKVTSAECGTLPVHERLRQLAIGYLSSAKSLCKELGGDPTLLTWPRASVVCFCYHHAIELFLKSCILFRVPKIANCSHDIAALRKQYFDLYPDSAFFFQTSWALSMDDIEQIFGGRPDIEPFEEKPDQLYRYLEKHGRDPKGKYGFAPGVWFWMIERLQDDIDRIWSNIHESEISR